MSINVNDKNIGHATAYAYAVAGGYTGTEAEFTELLGNIADDLGQIENLTVTVETLAAGSSATASYSNGVLHLGIPKGDKGDKGDTGATGPTGPTGNGIASVAKTGTSGLVDTYTITYTNGNTSTFTVTNGAEAVDNTLTIAGRAADAKKTGDELESLKSEFTAVNENLLLDKAIESIWEQGGIASSNGVRVDAQNRIRTNPLDSSIISVTPNSGYKVAVFCYNSSDTFVGVWNGSTTATGSITWIASKVELSTLIATYKIRVVGSLTGDTSITPESATNFIFEVKVIPEIESNVSVLDTRVTNIENKVEVVLPNKIYGVVGQEFDLYKDNALMYANIDTVASVRCMGFYNGYLETRKRFKCVPASANDNYIQYKLYKDSLVQYDVLKNLRFIISDPAILNGLTRNIVIIGDSKVAGGRLPQVFKNLCTGAGMTVGKLFGSVYNPTFDVNDEGRTGWSSSDYMTSGKGGVTNPFYNNGFDFSYWMTQQAYTHMDYVFINLGTNDYSAESGLGSDTYISTFISNINTMITSIHAYDPDIKIVIGLAEGVCTSQFSDLSDDKLRCLTTRARLLNNAAITEWNNSAKEGQNIFVCPIYLSMDMENDYITETVPLSQWDETYETGRTFERVTDKMHQNSVGYAKNATYMFALMTYIESLSE